jgi:twitching motility protein PilT
MRYVRSQVPDFKQLGLMDITANLADSHRGIILVAGTTGSGKSTTLAAMIEHINSNARRHIVTLEDPIEYVFEDNQSIIEQREVGLDTPSFASSLKSALRQDPDVIMIGEMRDSISFAAAMNAADTGHLVLSTLHTTNSSQSVTRILDYFKADEREQVRRQLAGTLKAVICQRMVPTITGKVVPAQEILINTGTVKKLIEDNRLDKLAAAIETGGEDGMQDFNQALFKLVQDGVVSKEEALAKATNPAALEMNFQGIFLSQGKRILG